MGNVKRLKFVSMLVWACIIGIFGVWYELESQYHEKKQVFTSAKAFYQEILVTRKWNASHGGVYVPITEETQPNQYLKVSNRDVSTTGGTKLTKLNPAYMTRQISNLAASNSNSIQFHITSLSPINPVNKATEWEERWLEDFEQGVKERGEFVEEGGLTWLRYMAPLYVETECLDCHKSQGYEEGQVRGGISVSVPYPAHGHIHLIIGYCFVVALGLLLIFIGGGLYERKQLLFNATFNSPVPTCVTGKDFTILMANESYWETFNTVPSNQKSIKCHDHRKSKSCHTEDCPITKIIGGEDTYTNDFSVEVDGTRRHFIVTAKPLLDTNGKVTGCVESFQEFTDRKLVENQLVESNRQLEDLITTDGLTGIANRRCLDEQLEKEHFRHMRSGARLSLILLDIDYFKLFNDTYGHISGDKCIQEVAKVVANCTSRKADLGARYGGEEFACILPETDNIGAAIVAERIRQDILGLAIPHKESKVSDHVSVSLGVATIQCTPDRDISELIAQADKLLYQAKTAGRNRVAAKSIGEIENESVSDFAQLVWKDTYNCGNEVIDSQHQALFQLSNEIFEAVLSERPAPEVSKLINKLLEDITIHFRDEENVLREIEYPGLIEHVKEHAELLEKGIQLSNEFKNTTLTIGDVFQFLAHEVVMNHLIKSDLEFFENLQMTC